MTRGAAAGRRRVPFLPEPHIEREAQFLLDAWAAKGHAISAPVPIGEIVELHLGLTFVVEDLAARFGTTGVFGAIWFNENTIRVDSSLDPSIHPQMLGRFNFTLAHEVGHWVLHRAHLRNDENAAALFGPGAEPAFVCRSGDRSPEEWQADKFASCLLMPRADVLALWSELRPDGCEIAIADIVAAAGGLDAEAAIQRFCRPLAERFEVSAQAMGIRLRDVGLIVNQVQPRLFR